jgi:hypothetical protein
MKVGKKVFALFGLFGMSGGSLADLSSTAVELKTESRMFVQKLVDNSALVIVFLGVPDLTTQGVARLELLGSEGKPVAIVNAKFPVEDILQSVELGGRLVGECVASLPAGWGTFRTAELKYSTGKREVVRAVVRVKEIRSFDSPAQTEFLVSLPRRNVQGRSVFVGFNDFAMSSVRGGVNIPIPESGTGKVLLRGSWGVSTSGIKFDKPLKSMRRGIEGKVTVPVFDQLLIECL